MLTEQMAVLGRRGVGVSEQAAQQGKGVAQRLASDIGLTVGPQERSQFAAGMHAPFDRQVEQQGLALRKGKLRRLPSCNTSGGPSTFRRNRPMACPLPLGQRLDKEVLISIPALAFKRC